MTEDEHFKRILVEDKFPAIDEITGDALSAEERDSYLSIINSCPFIVENNYKIVQMFIHKKSGEEVSFNGMISWNDEQRMGGFCVDGVIDFKNEIIEIRFAMKNKDFDDYQIIKFDQLLKEKRKAL